QARSDVTYRCGSPHLRGTITAAAHALSYTPSAVSQQLSLLEKEAGAPLLQKVGRGVLLTSAAEELVRHADEILAILERAEAGLAASDTQVRGTLRLAAFASISLTTIPRVIAALNHQHPALDIRFRQVEPEQGLSLLSSRRIDALVVDSYPGTSEAVPDSLHADLLTHDPIRAYLPGATPSAKLEELKHVKWILEPSGSEAHAWVRRVCRERGFEPDVAYESANLLFHLRMVTEGLAAAFLPDLLIQHEGADLKPSALPGTPQHRTISLVCRAGAEQRPAIEACRDTLAAHLDTNGSLSKIKHS
ncbi:LysR family transcriptional regulator, partial [Sediminivirga luteola]|uniref:LysR family transcriptional regulator n=2 Tax=Sediminivirga luteola TaxID=1774748 RepID=UPI001F330643